MCRRSRESRRPRETVAIGDDYPALLRARRQRQRWGKEEKAIYTRHRWRVEGIHGEAKTCHGLARAVRRGLGNMKIQAYLTAAAINLKRPVAFVAAQLGIVLKIIGEQITPTVEADAGAILAAS